MDNFTIKNLSFSYPNQQEKALNAVNLSVKQGEFLLVCGPSGCGKSTLLRQLKSVLAPHGVREGEILFEGKSLAQVDARTQSGRIGFVRQNVDEQIVTDKVWHELAFGLESLGYDTPTIRRKVAEMASFFGIETWFYKDVTELSGGQKQLLNLASVMAMSPSVLILDEPTSQLDPIAASEFLSMLGRINRELGTTVILTEHRLEEAFALASRVAVMDRGSILCAGSSQEVGLALKECGHEMFLAMPTAMRVWAATNSEAACPVTVREGRAWLAEYLQTHAPEELPAAPAYSYADEVVIRADEVFFKYEKNSLDVVKGLSVQVKKGEFVALLGGNGAGKTTTLKLLAGVHKPYRGEVQSTGRVSLLPQNPQALFVKKTVREDLCEALQEETLCKEEQQTRIADIARLCRLTDLLERHPYDLSGGEQQRAALAKLLLTRPNVLLLDEPTKGLDSAFKQTFADILKILLSQGVTILMVSHDVEFCANYAHRCALLFDGAIVTEGTPRKFFGGNSFYTTAANRIARDYASDCVTAEDLIAVCGGTLPPTPCKEKTDLPKPRAVQADAPLCAAKKKRVNKRTVVATILILLLIPLTLFLGEHYFDGRKYYLTSLLVLFECMLPFFLIFESRKPQARELVLIAVLCAIAVAGRAVFFMLPQFKPVMALCIIAGASFGAETGFLVGAMSMLTSNMLFSQGPWTPWQMFCMGIIGFLAGLLFKNCKHRRRKLLLCIFGALSAIVIYGGIMNTASALMMAEQMSLGVFASYWAAGFPMDCMQAVATWLFLWLAAEPMLEKLERIRIKYGLAE